MGFNFPNAPLEGQVYQPPGGPVYTWRSPVWEAGDDANQQFNRRDITDFGAKPGEIFDNLGAINGMGAAVGYAIIPAGSFYVDSGPIDYPLFFDAGAYFTIPTGVVVAITNRIESPRQWIFRGLGTVQLRVEVGGDSGEDGQVAHVSWFGAMPTNVLATDMTPAIQKAMNAFPGDREGILQFDVGSYHVFSTMTVPRGLHIRGSGIRRTVFDVHGGGYDVFTTTGDAVEFSNFQFEQPSGLAAYRLGSLINLGGPRGIVDNVWLWTSEIGISVTGDDCRIQDIQATYPVDTSAATAMIRIRANGCVVDGVRQLASPNSPPVLVRASPSSLSGSNWGTLRISNIENFGNGIPVMLSQSSTVLSRVIIENVITSGTAPCAVRLETTGSGGVKDIIVRGVIATANSAIGIDVVQGSSGIMENITIAECIFTGAGTGISLTRTAGTLRDINIGDTVNTGERTTPLLQSGTISGVKVSPSAASPLANEAPTYLFTNLATDTVAVVDLGRSVFSAAVELTGNIVRHGIFTARAAATPSVSANRITDANTVAVATALTGTTGTAGNLTLGVQDRTLYVENRTGGTLNVTLSVRAG